MKDLYGTKEERRYTYSKLRTNKLYEMLTKEQRSQFVDNLLEHVNVLVNIKKLVIAHRLGNDRSASYTICCAFRWDTTPQGYDYWRTLRDSIEGDKE